MTFDQKTLLPASNKFYMVRIQAGLLFTKYNTTHVQTHAGVLVAATFQVFEAYIHTKLNIKDFKIKNGNNEVTFTRVDSWSAPEVGGVAPHYNTYYYNPETGYIKFSSNQIGTTYIQSHEAPILEHYLCFTQYTGKRTHINMDSGTEVYWAPRLPLDMDLDYSQNNSLNGQLSISTSQIELKNSDLYFNDFFSDHDSFNNREVKVWRCIDSVDDYQFEFKGTIRGAYLDDDVCNLEVNDILTVLDNTFYGGYESYKHYSDMADVTYLIRGDDQQRPVYRVLGKISPYGTYYYNTTQDLQIRLLDPEKMIPATCVSYNGASKTTSTNRTWSCGFGPEHVTDVTAVYTSHLDQGIGTYHASFFAGMTDVESRFAVGDTFKVGSVYGIIVGVSSTSISAWPYNVSFPASGTVTRAKVPAVVIVAGGTKYYCRSFRDYSCQIGSKGDLQIVFVNNFEANHSGMPTLDPDECEVYIRFWNEDYDSKASEITKLALEEAGLECDSAFVPDQSPSWYDPYLTFTVPFIDSVDYPSCQEIVQMALRSAMAFIYFDKFGKIRYKSFLDGIHDDADIENQSGQDHNDAINETNSTRFGVQFDLHDQYIGTYFRFSHLPQSDGQYAGNNDSAYRVGGTDPMKKLYNTNKYYEVDTVLDVNAYGAANVTAFLEAYNKLITGRRAEYSLDVFSRHFKLYIGDDILVSRTKITGGVNETYMRVIGISKGVNKSSLKLLDLLGFPK
jgi:hypothetical protein